MSTVSNDHYNGFFKFESEEDLNSPSSLPNIYRRYRANVLSIIDKLDFRTKINFIKKTINDNEELLKSNDEIYTAYTTGDVFFDEDYQLEFRRNGDLQRASFLNFLNILLLDYQFIYNDNFSSIKWVKDIPTFENLYNVLTRYSIIDVEYFEFTAFWQMKDKTTINFKSTIAETSVLFLKLIEKACMSQLTLDAMLDKELIYVKHGRNKSIRSLDFATYQRTINQYKSNAETKVFDHEFKPVLEALKIL
ncbi:MAG: hypothetical protein KGZ71_08895 [Desulfobulbaceae bacterium]|nr:hypothetical protein [Candidatus Kapabacteria bacterium]MBS4000585.1 hypothetical protein [Desulfobulbaceae bacterium]